MLAFSRPRALFAFGNLYRRVWVYFWFSQSSAQVLHFRAPWINGASLHWSMSTTLMSIEQLEGQSINQSITQNTLFIPRGNCFTVTLPNMMLHAYFSILKDDLIRFRCSRADGRGHCEFSSIWLLWSFQTQIVPIVYISCAARLNVSNTISLVLLMF